MCAIMAAGLLRLLLVYLILASLADKFRLCATRRISKVNAFITGCGSQLVGSGLSHKPDVRCFKVVKFKSTKFTSRTRIRRESSVWVNQDLIICVGVERNPGDTELAQDSSFFSTCS